MASLNPAQQETLDLVVLPADGIPMPSGLQNRLTTLIEEGTRDAVTAWRDARQEVMWLTKAMLTAYHQCEGFWKARYFDDLGDPFAHSVRTVQGTVVHRAIELQHRDRYSKTEAAYVRLALEAAGAEDDSVAAWLADASEAETLTLESNSVALLASFNDVWPPLSESIRVQANPHSTARLVGGGLVLSAKPDLLVGPTPRFNLARQSVVDLKTSPDLFPESREEAWFYALVLLLRVGVPPGRSIVYSVPSGAHHPSPEIDEDCLTAAARRVVGAARGMARIARGEDARLSPSAKTYCGWCPASDSCPALAAAAAND